MRKIAMDDEAEKPQSAQSSEGGDMNPEDEFLRRNHEVALHVRFVAQGFPATIAKKFIAGIEALAAELVVEKVQVDIEGFTPLD